MRGDKCGYPTYLSAFVVSVCFRVFQTQNLGSIWLTSIPYVLLMIRTLGFSALGPLGKSFHFPSNPLVHFRATQAACPHACRAFTDGLGRLADHPQNAPRIRSSAFQHIRIEKPSFHFLFPENVWKTFALFSKSPVPGFGYPFHGGFS
jgi:hypothetical protein